ncbi:MAG: ankyrin repeat domain-containing protein [Proteobacteria bacterium]|nr:ankyrin repeat domain-containing protein [Pseudomonadota bacterium]
MLEGKKVTIVEADPYEDPKTFMQFVEELTHQPSSVVAQKIKEGLFLHAVKKENLEVLKRILQAQNQSRPIFDIFLRDNNGEHAFQHAIRTGNLEALELLINYCNQQSINFSNVAHEIILRGPESLVIELLDPKNSDLYKRILALPSTHPYSCEELATAGRQELNGAGVVHDESVIRLADLRLKFAHQGKEPSQSEFDQNLKEYILKKNSLRQKEATNTAALFELSRIANEAEIDQVISRFEPELCLEILKTRKDGLNYLHQSAMVNDELQTKIAYKLFEKANSKSSCRQDVMTLLKARILGKSAIYVAAESNNALFLKLFLKPGVPTNNTGPKYCPSALMAAAKNGACDAVIEIILRDKIALYDELFTAKTKDENGLTLAHYLAHFDKTGNAFSALLDHSTIKTAQPFRNIMLLEDKDGNSVFDYLMQNENAEAVLREIVRTMKTWHSGWGLEHIFDINTPRKNKNGLTDLEWLIKNGSPEIVKIFSDNLYEKKYITAASEKIKSLQSKQAHVPKEKDEAKAVDSPQAKSTFCGVRVYTYGTKAQETTGVMHQINTTLWGGNVGHAAVTLIIPADEVGKELIKKYCLDPAIPYQKQKVVTAKAGKEREVMHEEEVYVINWSWWPRKDGTFYLRSALNLDGLSEREGVHRPMAPEWAQTLGQITRVHGGAIGSTRTNYGTTGMVHVKDNLSDTDKQILILKADIPRKKENLESCEHLLSKLAELVKENIPVMDITSSRYMTQNTKELINTFFPKQFQNLIKDKATLSIEDLRILKSAVASKVNTLKYDHEQDVKKLERLTENKKASYQQIHDQYQLKAQEKEQLEQQYQQDIQSLEEAQKLSDDLALKKEEVENLKNYFMDLLGDLENSDKQELGINLQAAINLDKDLKAFETKDKLDLADISTITSNLHFLLQTLTAEQEKSVISLEDAQEKAEQTKTVLDQTTDDFLKLEREYWPIASQMPTARYQELLAHEEAVTATKGWCYLQLEKNNDDPIELGSDFAYWLQRSQLKNDLDPGFDYQVDVLKLSRAEIEQIRANAIDELKRIKIAMVDEEPCQGLFDAGENEQFVTMGTTPDHVLDLPLDAMSLYHVDGPKPANQVAQGINAERMLEKMHDIVSCRTFDLSRNNCSRTSLDILEAGADPTLRDVFAVKAYGGLETPQMVYSDTLAYQHRMHHEDPRSTVTAVSDTIARYSPFNFIERMSAQAIADAAVEPSVASLSKAALAVVGVSIGMAGQAPRRALNWAFGGSEPSSPPPSPTSVQEQFFEKDESVKQMEECIVYIHAYTPQQAIKVWEKQLNEHTGDNKIPFLSASTNALFDNLPQDQKITLIQQYQQLQKRSLDKMREMQANLSPTIEPVIGSKNKNKQ